MTMVGQALNGCKGASRPSDAASAKIRRTFGRLRDDSAVVRVSGVSRLPNSPVARHAGESSLCWMFCHPSGCDTRYKHLAIARFLWGRSEVSEVAANVARIGAVLQRMQIIARSGVQRGIGMRPRPPWWRQERNGLFGKSRIRHFAVTAKNEGERVLSPRARQAKWTTRRRDEMAMRPFN